MSINQLQAQDEKVLLPNGSTASMPVADHPDLDIDAGDEGEFFGFILAANKLLLPEI